MKVINAIWEKRNLGIDVVEVEISRGDSAEEVSEKLNKIKADYVSVKLPSYLTEFLDIIQHKGYVYREDLIHVRHRLQSIPRTAVQQRMYDTISYHEMSSRDICELKSEIERGMFSSDRFSIDSRFTKEQCANRYVNWVDDLLINGAKPFVMEYKGEHSGFIILKTEDKKTYQSILGGAYEKFRNSGLGIVQKEQEIVKILGGICVETTVSSNNVAQLKALIQNGYIPYDVVHVFSRWNRRLENI